jgi:hypothetical protein
VHNFHYPTEVNAVRHLYSSFHIFMVIKSRRMRWAERITCIRYNTVSRKCIQHFGWETSLDVTPEEANNRKMYLLVIGYKDVN